MRIDPTKPGRPCETRFESRNDVFLVGTDWHVVEDPCVSRRSHGVERAVVELGGRAHLHKTAATESSLHSSLRR